LRRLIRSSFVAISCLLTSVASGDAPVRRLRLATAAPDGTAWAREFRAFARDVEAATSGKVQVKWYFGGIAGDELQVGDRIRRDQLDGTASAGMFCQKLAPSARLIRLPGLFESRNEAVYVHGRLTPILTQEFAKEGFAYLGGPNLGPDVLFTRDPVRSFEDLRRLKLWRWEIDAASILAANGMGLSSVPLNLEAAIQAYDEGRVDGFFAIPSAALAFQWATRARYLTDLEMSFMSGCLLVASRAFDSLTIDQQHAVRAAGAKAIARVTEVSAILDDQLLKTLFAKQGMHPVAVTRELRDSFRAAATDVRRRIGDQLAPNGVMATVQHALDEYRAQHSSSGK
jgi:TRAP-type C4-dicarboxylate transport system substrate-binding protein